MSFQYYLIRNEITLTHDEYSRYPSLRVAYIDEIEETVNGKPQKAYYSVLVKGGEKLDEV